MPVCSAGGPAPESGLAEPAHSGRSNQAHMNTRNSRSARPTCPPGSAPPEDRRRSRIWPNRRAGISPATHTRPHLPVSGGYLTATLCSPGVPLSARAAWARRRRARSRASATVREAQSPGSPRTTGPTSRVTRLIGRSGIANSSRLTATCRPQVVTNGASPDGGSGSCPDRFISSTTFPEYPARYQEQRRTGPGCSRAPGSATRSARRRKRLLVVGGARPTGRRAAARRGRTAALPGVAAFHRPGPESGPVRGEGHGAEPRDHARATPTTAATGTSLVSWRCLRPVAPARGAAGSAAPASPPFPPPPDTPAPPPLPSPKPRVADRPLRPPDTPDDRGRPVRTPPTADPAPHRPAPQSRSPPCTPTHPTVAGTDRSVNPGRILARPPVRTGSRDAARAVAHS